MGISPIYITAGIYRRREILSSYEREIKWKAFSRYPSTAFIILENNPTRGNGTSISARYVLHANIYYHRVSSPPTTTRYTGLWVVLAIIWSRQWNWVLQPFRMTCVPNFSRKKKYLIHDAKYTSLNINVPRVHINQRFLKFHLFKKNYFDSKK